MASNTAKSEISTNKFNGELTNHEKTDKTELEKPYRREFVWHNIIAIVSTHLAFVYVLYIGLTTAKILTYMLAIFLGFLSGLGVTAGAHRLWAHRGYKATWQLRAFLIFCNLIAFEGPIINWCRDHRLHHKHSETNADPHNAKRGFFFAHVGWLFYRKHPDVSEKGKGIDLSDLYADPLLRLQKKYYLLLSPIFAFVVPTLIPVYCWNETWLISFLGPAIGRWVYIVNTTWFVNSAAHLYGKKSYDKNINPSENLFVAIIAMGEGWHNYHHTFPWDYKTAELGNYYNFTTSVIDFFASIGWAYDLKTVSPDVIKARVLRTGDGSHQVWGWGDKSATKAQLDATITTHKRL